MKKFNNFFSAQVEVVATADTIEIFRGSFSYCDFVNPKGLNFMARALVSNIERLTNPDILKCPFKKGYLRAYEFKEEKKKKYVPVPAPPFMKLGQRFDVSIHIRSVVDKKKEILCSVSLRYVIVN